MKSRAQCIENLKRAIAEERGAIDHKETFMADDRTKTALDRKLISLKERPEVNYWTMALGCSEEALRQAVRDVGRSADKVRDHLRKK